MTFQLKVKWSQTLACFQLYNQKHFTSIQQGTQIQEAMGMLHFLLGSLLLGIQVEAQSSQLQDFTCLEVAHIC